MNKPFCNILHLDAGRKYFRPSSICRLMNQAASCGYNQFQFAFGNDGLRLLLDDMAVDGQDSETVKEAIRRGNQEYNGDPSCLTQAKMDEILAYARAKHLELVPMFNLPGHMAAALAVSPDSRWNDEGRVSLNSLDVAREDAVTFGLGLLHKYVEYFAGRGCRCFQFGADEYGNDIHQVGGLGFSRLEQQGRYECYVNFLNRAAKIITDAGMIPRAFNDGFYYHENTSVWIDPQIQVCYWGKGWIGFDCAKVSTIAEKGHPVINCHGDWYYVLKPEGTVQRPTEYAPEGRPGFESFRAEAFPGEQYFAEPAGAMFCIWCDNSTLLTDEEVAEDAAGQIAAMAKKVMRQ